MSFLLGILIFVLALLFSIMLHEAGHFVTAKKFGMKVTQFFVGFGQTLWSRRKGETEYGVKAIPAGGFVKIVGMTELEDIDPADEPRSFRRQPGWQRIIVLAAGSFMHFVLAFVLLFALAIGIGLAGAGTSTTVGAIDTCVPSSLTSACKPSNPASPAKRVGIRAGDKIIAVAGTPVRNWTQMGKVLRRQPAGTPVAVTVQRGGQQVTLHPSLAVIHGRQGSYLGVSPVGAFNLLPLLPLDGGHLAIVIYERCRAWLARLRGKPDPGPVDFRRFVPVSVGVFALLVGFGLLLILADLVNPVHILQ